MGLLRNGTVPAEYQVAMTLRWLSGGSIYECMDGHVIARSTVYSITSRVIRAMNSCPELNCKWPEGEDVTRAAGLFRNRSSFGVIRKCIGAIDGLFIRLIKPTAQETAEPNSYFSGHKKGFGTNFQAVCDAEYRIIAWTMNCPGSQNDRTARPRLRRSVTFWRDNKGVQGVGLVIKWDGAGGEDRTVVCISPRLMNVRLQLGAQRLSSEQQRRSKI
eukprot:g7868.t1